MDNILYKEFISSNKHIFCVMRNTALALFIFVGTAVASESYSQTMKVTVVGNNLTTGTVISEIEKQTDYLFVYKEKEINLNRQVNVNAQNETVASVLNKLFESTDVYYAMEGSNIMLMKRSASLQRPQSDNKIRGVVKDANGEPVIGASIVAKGKTTGTITDMNGQFVLDVPSNSIIKVTCIGYLPQDIKIQNKKELNIILREDTRALEEVVVVGYGAQKKVNLTGAVTAVSGAEMIKRPVANAENMLQGQIPGLSVVQKSGQPGSDDASFRIRGQGTYSNAGSDPLVLINGVPGSLATLDPNIIESVSVLKDAASASIYGSRAANGVILVTTKKGSLSSAGKKFSAQYSGNLSIYTPTRMIETITNSAEYMELFNLAKKNSQRAGLYDTADIEKYRKANGSDLYPNFDWVDYMFNPAVAQTHNISLSGNATNTTYNISLNITDQPGTMRGFDYQKYNFSVDLNSEITKWLKIGTYISANYSQKSEPRNGAQDAFLCTLAQAPTSKPWIPDDGTGITKYAFSAFPNIEQSNKNMLAMVDNDITARRNAYDMNGQFYVEISPIRGLKWFTKIAGRLYDNRLKDWSGTKVPLYNYQTGAFVRDMDLGGGFIPGLQIKDEQTKYTNLYSFIEYQFPFLPSAHSAKVMIGYNQEKNIYDYLMAKRRDYQFNLHELNAGSEENMENEGKKEEWAIMSGFFRLNYDYKGIYLFEANARYDGTSRIASGSRWGWFPSFSVGYRVTEENYMKKLHWTWLSNLKLRGSWGQLGNQNIGVYPYQALVELTDNYPFDNSTITQGVAQTTYVNRNLKWEKTTIADIGADITLFDRLNIVFDWYHKKTTDILREAQVSDFIGLKAPTINDGEMINKGFELSVNWNDYIREGFFKGLQYNAGFYVDRTRNELSKFGTDEKKSNTILKEGIPYDSWYMLEAIGIFANQAEIDAAPKQFEDNTCPGDIRYRDVDGNGVIDYDDRVIIDGRFPKFEYSFNLGASWKGFDLSMMFQGVEGKKNYVGTGAGVVPFAQGSIITRDYVDGMWTEEHPENASHPRLYFGNMGGTRNTRANSYFLRNTSYLRLKNLTFGYTFPVLWTKKAAIERLRLFLSGDNLLTFTAYKGLDPENGGAFLTYPQNKIFSFGINVEF